MSDNEIEDIQFLPGNNARKRGVYEPNTFEKCKQFICTPVKSTLIIVSVLAVIFLIALICALARPPANCDQKQASPSDPSHDSTSTPDSSFPWSDLRLPKDITPVFYDLYMHPNLDTFTFQGHVNITVEVSKDVKYLLFHSKNLTLHSQRLYRALPDYVHEINIEKVFTDANSELVYLQMSDVLMAGNNYTLFVNFSGYLSDHLAGFYRSSYKTKSGDERWLATTQFEPTDARAAFPCLDEPELKAQFRLSIVRQQNQITLSNMIIEKTEPLTQGSTEVVDHYKLSVKMSTYLVAFIVCDLVKTEASIPGRTSNVGVSVYAPSEYVDQARLAAEVAPKILDYYEIYFGIKYPLPKSDHVAIPDFAAGAMENWGLITYRLRSLLVNDTTAAPMDTQYVVIVIAHELAHQWFGNIVTMRWWNDLWLNEGFATYVSYKGSNHVRPEWKMFDQFLVSSLLPAMKYDGLKSSHPISTDVRDPKEIEELFDLISYEKGASIIRMLDSFLGEEHFQAGLKKYLNKHKFSNAETKDLWISLSEEAAADVNVVDVMNSWTNQMGYPVVMVQRDGSQVTLTQKRFLFNPRSKVEEKYTSTYGYRWHIPVSYKTSRQSNEELTWMHPDQAQVTLTLPSSDIKWIKCNLRQTGVYRVMYDPALYQNLIGQLKKDMKVFDASDRAGLLDDAFALARSGDVKISVAMDMSTYLVNETEYVAWELGLQSLRHICRLMVDRPSFVKLRKYMLKLVDGFLNDQLWEKQEDHIDKFRQEMFLGLALYLDHESTKTTALGLFSDWMNDGILPHASIKTLVFQAGAKFGGKAEYNYLLDQYKKASDLEKKNYLRALSATTDALNLKRLLHMSLDPDEVRTQDTASLISLVSSNPAGQELAWTFIKENWNTIRDKFTGMAFQLKHFIEVPRHLATEYIYDDVKEFFTTNLKGENERTVNQVLEEIEMNMDWVKRNQKNLENWLDSKKPLL